MLLTFLTTSPNTTAVPPQYSRRKKIFAALFSGKKYDDTLMRYLIHQILKIVKIYFIQKQLETDETDMQILLSRAARKRGLDDFFEREIESAAKLNSENLYRDGQYHFKNYLILSEQLKYIIAKRRKGEVPYEAIAESLTQFFCTEVLRHNCEAQSYKAVIGRDLKMDFLDETIHWFEAKMGEKELEGSTDNLSTKIYYHTFRALQSCDNQHFEELKRLISQYSMYLPKEEVTFIYSAAMNFCTKKINMGESPFRVQLFDLMQTGLEKKLFLDNGFLSKFIYKNVVTTGLLLEKYDWVRDFIESSKENLHPKERELVYNYNLAVYYFRKGDYDQAMPLLQRGDFGDVLTNLAARALLLRIYYDTEAFDALMSLTDSFQIFLSRQKELTYQKDNYSNLIHIVRKMLRLDLRNAEIRKRLREEIQQTQYLAERSWLLEKLAD